MVIGFDAVAWGIIDGVTGVLSAGRGATTSKVATGRYNITLPDDFQLDNSEMMITVTSCDAAARFVGFISGTDTVKRVEAFNQAGINADATICFKIDRLRIL